MAEIYERNPPLNMEECGEEKQGIHVSLKDNAQKEWEKLQEAYNNYMKAKYGETSQRYRPLEKQELDKEKQGIDVCSEDNVQKAFEKFEQTRLNFIRAKYLESYNGKPPLKIQELDKEKQGNDVCLDDILQKTHLYLNQAQKYYTKAEHLHVLLENLSEPVASSETTDTLKTCSPEEFLRVRTERAAEIYPIKDKNERSRQALIICNIVFDHLSVRNGAKYDIIGMKKLLEGLDYTVTVKENLTAKDMASVLSEFADKPEHKLSDSTFLVFMSHGILQGICGIMHSEKNPDVLQYDTIFNIFNNKNCPDLRDKPKVIIVQACRGGNSGGVWVRDSPAALEDAPAQSPENLESDAVYMTHVEKDFITFHSTTPHNESWRNTTKGSYFIIKLIAGLQKYAWCYPLQEIFQKIQLSCEKANDIAQMPTIERSTAGRLFFLFPGN